MGQYCDHLRVLRINESESLGPAMARYFASKLWHGEAFYMQIDAHMFFAEVRAFVCVLGESGMWVRAAPASRAALLLCMQALMK